MSLEQIVNEGIKKAMLARNEPELRSLRAIKAAILIGKTSEGGRGELSEADESQLLQKLVKQRKDSLEIFRAQKREDLATREEEELAVIQRFLPAQMSPGELREAVSQIIAEMGATGPADTGKVTGSAVKKLTGKADGKQIAAMVRELLTK